jgi:predicted O-linked N-acetylglucosamine transferase (SPINDLY family)
MANLPSTDPRFVQALCTLEEAVQCQRLGRLEEADRLYARVLKKNPDYFDALNFYGVFKYQQGKLNDALKLLTKASIINPRSVNVLNNLGVVLNLLKRDKDSLTAFDRALALDPNNVMSLNNCGNTLANLDRLDDAIASFDRAIALQPNYSDAHNNRGRILFQLQRYAEALASYDRGLAAAPMNADVHHNRAAVLQMLKRTDEALASYDRAIALKPNYADAWSRRASIFSELKLYDQAILAYDKALAIKSDHANSWAGRGNIFFDHRHYDEALLSFDKALAVKPDLKYLAGLHLHAKMQLCDWSGYDDACARLIAAVQAGHSASPPFALIAIPCSVNDQLKCAQVCAADKSAAFTDRFWRGEQYSHDRIRVAYVSADFREHPISYLMAGMFEQHDRSRFEIFAISISPDQPSAMRERLKKIFDQFIDADKKSDLEIAALLREMEIDILVDLMGYTHSARSEIFALRPAPIQAGFLGYPGTSGSDFIDYFIGDPIALPFDQQPYYTEKIVHLPDCFMPTDSKQSIARDAPARSDSGLPEGAFVFCSFHDNYKITALMFDIWMRLLRAVEGSVLWLLHSNDTAVANLRREAEARGIAGDRLIFAPRLAREKHLARIPLADLFLNTHPVNAGATAIDALSMGLPIVSYIGEAFVERVTASLLHAAGLPELVTTNLADYEALALKLAREPALLAEIKARLARNRDTTPLFNNERFTRHIESAYTNMWERWQRGEAPQSFSVEPSPS